MKLPIQIPIKVFENKKYFTALEWSIYVYLHNGCSSVAELQKIFEEDVLSSLNRLQQYNLVSQNLSVSQEYNFDLIKSKDKKPKQETFEISDEKIVPVLTDTEKYKWQTHLAKVAMSPNARRVSFEVCTILKYNLESPYAYIKQMTNWVRECQKIADIIGDDVSLLWQAKKELDVLNFTYSSPMSFFNTIVKLKTKKQPRKNINSLFIS